MGRVFLKGGTLLAPLPAVLVTCGSMEGEKNVFTAAWTGIACTRPPVAYISVRPERHSYGIIERTGEFVLNLTTSKMARETDLCGMKSGKSMDKFAKCRFTAEKAQTVDCPVLADSPLSIECRVKEKIDLGSHTMFLADVTGVTADEKYIDSKGKINLNQAGLMAYSHGEYFALGRKLGDFGFSVRKNSVRKRSAGKNKRGNGR